jgi:hypothetical protein
MNKIDDLNSKISKTQSEISRLNCTLQKYIHEKDIYMNEHCDGTFIKEGDIFYSPNVWKDVCSKIGSHKHYPPLKARKINEYTIDYYVDEPVNFEDSDWADGTVNKINCYKKIDENWEKW